MTISFILKRSKVGISKDAYDVQATIYVRLRDGRMLDSTAVTGLTVNPLWWDAKREEVKANVVCSNKDKKELNDTLSEMKAYLYEKHTVDKAKGKVNKEWLAKAVEKFRKGKNEIVHAAPDVSHTFQNRFQQFLDASDLKQTRVNQYRVIERAVLRFEAFVRMTRSRSKQYVFDVRTVDENDLMELYGFMSKEHIYYEKYPEIYEMFPEKRQSKPRGANTLSENFKKLRAFFNWCHMEGYIHVSPFSKFKFEKELYGTPYYLTTDEVQQLLNTDLSSTPEYERQRDVFVFHCCIGCRVGDLLRLTKSDIINGAIEYIPTKTISDNAKTVRVPLNATALSIIEKYKDYSETKLLPFISSQKYNDYIKVVIEKCGITRQVTVLNSLTRKEEKVPIYTVASSHMARRTFIANIYNKVQDPNLIGSMTGHVEGSRAFARYRAIDESVKKNLVDILG